MSDNIFFLNDIQDIWLFYALMREGSTVIVNQTGKQTSPHNFINQLKNYNVVSYDRSNQSNFLRLLDSCKYFITKECMPFAGENKFADKTISVGWLGESATRVATQYNIKNCYKYHFVEHQIIPLYVKLGFDNVSDLIPKYYIFNNLNRDSACKVLGLDPDQKYMTVFTNMFYTFDSKNKDETIEKTSPFYTNSMRIFNKILGYCKSKGIKVIVKNKMKYGNFMRDKFPHDAYFAGNNIFYHQSLLLSAISEFSVGFGTGAAAESECLGAPFVNFWRCFHVKQERSKVEDGVINSGGSYRLCNSEFVYNIYPGDTYDDLRDNLFDFIGCSRRYNFDRKFKIHEVFNV